MDVFDEMLRNFSQKFYNKMKKFSSPLTDHLRISNIAYYKISDSGQYSFIGIRPDFDEYYHSEKMYLVDPYVRPQKNYPSGISLIKSVDDDKVSEILQSIIAKFNLHYSLHLRFRTVNGSENFSIALSSGSALHHAALINELPLIKLFIKRFREEFKLVLKEMDENAINIAQLIGSEFYKSEIPLVPAKIPLQQILNRIGVPLPDSLTFRETEIVRQLVKGLPASRIGKELFISKRTVENHMERIKEKFGCQSKADLILQIQELESVGYFENSVAITSNN